MLSVILLAIAAAIVWTAYSMLDDAISLWWLRKQPPARRPAGREMHRVWTMDCHFVERGEPHPAHRWRRSALKGGNAPTSHPNYCPGLPAR